MSAGTLAGVSEPEESTAETTGESEARLWLAEVIWMDGRIQYLIAAEDEVDAADQMSMIPGVKGAMDLGLIGALKPGPAEVWRSGNGPPPEFPLTGPPRPIDSYGNR
jgi:hypothetical protein